MIGPWLHCPITRQHSLRQRQPSGARVRLANLEVLGAAQRSAEERGVDTHAFKGVITFAGKHEGVDCAAGSTDLTDKVSDKSRASVTGRVRFPASACAVHLLALAYLLADGRARAGATCRKL